MSDVSADTTEQDEKSLLIVEDDDRFADTLATEFRDRGYTVAHVADIAGLKATDPSAFSYAVVDLRLRRDSGLDAITSIKERSPGTKVVVLTGYGSIATAVQATKNGATNYLTKPIDAGELIISVEKALEHRKLIEEKLRLERENLEYQRNLEKKIEEMRSFEDNLDILQFGVLF